MSLKGPRKPLPSRPQDGSSPRDGSPRLHGHGSSSPRNIDGKPVSPRRKGSNRPPRPKGEVPPEYADSIGTDVQMRVDLMAEDLFDVDTGEVMTLEDTTLDMSGSFQTPDVAAPSPPLLSQRAPQQPLSAESSPRGSSLSDSTSSIGSPNAIMQRRLSDKSKIRVVNRGSGGSPSSSFRSGERHRSSDNIMMNSSSRRGSGIVRIVCVIMEPNCLSFNWTSSNSTRVYVAAFVASSIVFNGKPCRVLETLEQEQEGQVKFVISSEDDYEKSLRRNKRIVTDQIDMTINPMAHTSLIESMLTRGYELSSTYNVGKNYPVFIFQSGEWRKR